MTVPTKQIAILLCGFGVGHSRHSSFLIHRYLISHREVTTVPTKQIVILLRGRGVGH